MSTVDRTLRISWKSDELSITSKRLAHIKSCVVTS